MTAAPPSPDARVVVVGGGLAAVTVVRALREAAWRGAPTLIGEEPHAPYDRPPLSKAAPA
jgi:3-phenylpropionate/trans-cinnamate dioxygenase ferredoxin reductase component